MENLDRFTRAYIEAALWSSNDESNESGGEPLDKNYGPEDIAPEALAAMVADCRKFQLDNYDTLEARYLSDSETETCTRAGHDFWLTRNGHGAGFWDGDWEEPAASQLTGASKAFGQVDLYVGDDGLIYQG